MSRDAAYQSQIEDEHDDLVMKIEFTYEVLANRMRHLEALPDFQNAKEVYNYAKSLAEDAEELLFFLHKKDFVSNT
jgi:hypothetical protein